MKNKNDGGKKMFQFIKQYIKNPKFVGAIAPSSKKLAAAMMQPIDFEKSETSGMKILEEQSYSLEDAHKFSFPLQADVSKKIVLSLSIEGWDKDSVNYTMFSRFLTSISFKLADGGNGGN